MKQSKTKSRFEATLLRPSNWDFDQPWAFVILPKDVSNKLPRRGRTSVVGTIKGQDFQAFPEPDGNLSHWLQVNQELLKAKGINFGDTVTFEIESARLEPEPEIPIDLLNALADTPDARVVWDETTTIARIDWIHWITSAKQSKTRDKRITDACQMLAAGKRRVCCFDPSGYYSKALSAPKADH